MSNKPFVVDKSLMVDTSGRYLTQGLFLEINYDRRHAVYSMKENDYEFEGKLYPSLKRLYLEHEDPLEYDFATTYLGGWRHWQRIVNNAMISKHIEEWREELEIKLRSRAVKDIIDKSSDPAAGFQAAKWLADRGWDKRGAGRPSKEEIEREKNIKERMAEEFSGDIARLADYKK